MSHMTNDELVAAFQAQYKADPVKFEDLPGISGRWDAKALVTLFELNSLVPNPTQEEMAKVLDFERSSVSRKISSMDWSEFRSVLEKLCSQTTTQHITDSAKTVRLEVLADHAIKQRKSEINNVAYMDHMFNSLKDAIPSMKQHRIPPLPPSTRRKTLTPESVVLLLSDMHVGQEFNLNDTGGLNEYNLAKFKERAVNLRKAVTDIYEIHSNLYDLPELNIFGLGDFVQGGNMVGQWGPAYNATIDVAEQTCIAAQTISSMITDWSSLFSRVNFYSVFGNHGRAGAKNMDKASANWDYIVAKLVAAQLNSIPNVKVECTQSWWMQKTINNSEFLLVHGDYVKGSVNSLYSEEQRFQSALAGRTKPFNYLCMGHFHSHKQIETSRGEILVNGSFVGGDVHSLQQIRSRSRATQMIFGVHPRHGKTWCYNLDLDYDREG